MLLRIQISNLPPKASFTNPHVFLVFLFNEDLENTADVYYPLINVFWTLKASRWVSDTGRQKITSESNRHTYSVNVKQPDACNNLTSEDCTSERLNTEVTKSSFEFDEVIFVQQWGPVVFVRFHRQKCLSYSVWFNKLIFEFKH